MNSCNLSALLHPCVFGKPFFWAVEVSAEGSRGQLGQLLRWTFVFNFFCTNLQLYVIVGRTFFKFQRRRTWVLVPALWWRRMESQHLLVPALLWAALMNGCCYSWQRTDRKTMIHIIRALQALSNTHFASLQEVLWIKMRVPLHGSPSRTLLNIYGSNGISSLSYDCTGDACLCCLCFHWAFLG